MDDNDLKEIDEFYINRRGLNADVINRLVGWLKHYKAENERLEERLTNQKKAVEDALDFGRQQSAEVERLKAANEKCEWEVQQAKIEAERRRQELTVMLNERLMPLEQENARLQNELGYLAFRRSYSECEEALITKIREILKGGE